MRRVSSGIAISVRHLQNLHYRVNRDRTSTMARHFAARKALIKTATRELKTSLSPRAITVTRLERTLVISHISRYFSRSILAVIVSQVPVRRPVLAEQTHPLGSILLLALEPFTPRTTSMDSMGRTHGGFDRT